MLFFYFNDNIDYYNLFQFYKIVKMYVVYIYVVVRKAYKLQTKGDNANRMTISLNAY